MKIIERGGLPGLAYRRKRAGLSCQQLADMIGLKSRQLINMYETGAAWPSARILPALADALVCSIDELYEAPPAEAEDSEDSLAETEADDYAG